MAALALGASRSQIVFSSAPFFGLLLPVLALSLIMLSRERHEHEPVEHVHAHWPDLHHRHAHI